MGISRAADRMEGRGCGPYSIPHSLQCTRGRCEEEVSLSTGWSGLD